MVLLKAGINNNKIPCRIFICVRLALRSIEKTEARSYNKFFIEKNTQSVEIVTQQISQIVLL